MKSKSITYLLLWSICSLFVFMQSCQETDDLKTDINRLKDRVAALEKATEGMNTSFASLQALIQANKTIIGVTPTKDGKGYSVELSDGTTVRVMNSESVAASVPVFSVDDEGYWMYKTASETDFRYLPGPDGEEKISAIPRTEAGTPILTPQLNVSSTGYWQVSYDGGTTFTTLKDADGQDIKAEGGKQGGTTVFSKVVYDEEKKTLSFTLAGTDPEQSYTFPVDDSFGLVIEGWNPDKIEEFAESEPFKEYNVRQTDIKEAMIQPLPGWNVRLTEEKLIVTPLPDVTKNKEETIKIVLTSSKNYIRIVSMSVKVLPSGVETPAWKQFKEKSDENVLLDFSYAGYMHGESAPAEMDEWIAKGYKVYDVTKYGAIPNDGQPDREAFMKVLAEIAGKPENIKKRITA
ncbi:TonB-dependent receptor [Bacteroides pyogenes JCM 6292]|uniref:TonB-dependent receptor n=2 Tax=Bacteroides pyogenes TaxID=310300 RepID=W4PEA6_9BACE|nr:TonB-dependent receptor [Bacteroides pyogenes JCM 6292]GAE17494.1 TonB-dependent receptor [Bacteroides pyogenes DSM 20611 = JCM 6294]